MRKRSRKAPSKVTRLRPRPRDANQLASAALRRTLELTGEVPEKDPIAVELGRRGGLKGGKARAAKLSSAELRASAVKAARARWAKAKQKLD